VVLLCFQVGSQHRFVNIVFLYYLQICRVQEKQTTQPAKTSNANTTKKQNKNIINNNSHALTIEVVHKMTTEQFNIQITTVPNVVNIIIMVMIVLGVVILVTGLVLSELLKEKRQPYKKIVDVSVGVSIKFACAILGIVLIVLGGLMYYGISSTIASPSVVTIDSGYINVESKSFIHTNVIGDLLSISGNKTVTSDEIATAFVGQVGSGDFKLHKNYGTNFGDTNVGLYTLGNGASAYVATTNSTCLIIELKTGEYLIVGNQDTQTIANSFSQNVHQLTPQR